MARARMSVLPPGVNGTISRTGFAGKPAATSAACAVDTLPPKRTAAATSASAACRASVVSVDRSCRMPDVRRRSRLRVDLRPLLQELDCLDLHPLRDRVA